MMTKNFFRVASLALFMGCIAIAWGYFNIGSAFNESWMDAYVRDQGSRGVCIYIGLVAVLTAMGVPRQACSLLGGYVFGMWFGTLWATLGTAIACAVCFTYARFLGQEWLHARYGHKLSTFNDFLCQSPFLLTLVVRIVPLGSNFLTNFLAGMSRIPALSFLGGSTVGFTVQNFIFASMGSGLRMDGGQELLMSGALYILSLSMGYWVYKKYKMHQKSRS